MPNCIGLYLYRVQKTMQKEANVIWRNLHRITPHTVHAPPPTSRVTDRLTNTAIVGNNSLHLVHSMRSKNQTKYETIF